jgi:hypothetical protein
VEPAEVAMALLFRTLRARPGREAALLDGLRHYVTRPARGREASLLLCRTDDPGAFVWMGLAAEARPGSEPGVVIDAVATDLVEPAPAVSLRFVDEWYRLPAPPYEIWNVEVRATGARATDLVTELLVPPGGSRAAPVVGRTVFRAIDDPAVFIGFVALTWSWLRQHPVPRLAGARDAMAAWRPLSVIYRAETYRGVMERGPLGSPWSGIAPGPAPAAAGASP